MTDDDLILIGDVARATGLPTSKIRYYENLGLIESQARERQHRRFHRSVLGRLNLIALAQQAGFNLTEIKELLAGRDDQDWRYLVTEKLDEITASIDQLTTMAALLRIALECGCGSFEQCPSVLAHAGARPEHAPATAGDGPHGGGVG